MKKKSFIVFPVLFAASSLCMFLFSLFIGRIAVFVKIYLPLGVQLAVGMIPWILVFLAISSFVLTFVFCRRVPVCVAVGITAAVASFFAFVFPVTEFFCDKNFDNCLGARIEYINGYLSNEREIGGYDVGKFKVDPSVSSSCSVKIGKIGKDDVFVFRANYGFFARYVMHVHGDANPESEILSLDGLRSLSNYSVIKEYGDGWYLVRDSLFLPFDGDYGWDGHFMGFDKSDFTVVKEDDTHGGFLGDGDYYLVLDCSSDPQKARMTVSDWTPLPFPKNTELFLYGEEGPGYVIGGCLNEEIMPRVKNGCYKFVDRNNRTDPSDESVLLFGISYNFKLAVYDFDTDTLYYYELDT